MSFFEHKWWKEAIGYQIYIKSFKDSNNDGIGDLNGIIEKLDYLQNLGVNLLWICPFYESPMDDNGYDVSNFFEVDPSFGTIKDFQNLVKEANKRKINIIVELILNQTSDESLWFKEARKSKNNKYRDYYIWADGKNINGNIVEPTNWASFFGGSAWEYDSLTNQYYMKIFSKKMPDLNWANQEVRKQMHEVANFWINLGAKGFRVDAVAHLGKKEKLVDSKMQENKKYQPDWRMFSNLPVTFKYLKEFNKEVFSKNDIVTVGEVGGGATVKEAIKYAGLNEGGLNMVFNFDHCWANNVHSLKNKDQKVEVNLLQLKNIFNNWQKGLYKKAWQPLYWLNHDHPRLLSQYGDTNNYYLSGSMLAASMYFKSGTPFIYQGEELGMVNYPFKTIKDFNDVSIKNYYNEVSTKKDFDEAEFIFRQGITSRDNARVVMSWENQEFAGFSNVKPWFHQDINYQTRNASSALKDEFSLFHFYKKIIKLRKDKRYLKTIVYGSYKQLLEKDEQIYCYLKEADKQILIITNFFLEEKTINIPKYEVKEVLLSNYNIKDVDLSNLKLRAYEALVCLVKRIK